MDPRIEQNRRYWNKITPIHERSDFYDVAAFQAGKNTLLPIERQEVGDVRGKSLLHLQCHFGPDTLSWARLGARVTGIDLADEAVALARRLAEQASLDVHFVRSNLYDLPNVLDEQFDIVFTSYGVLWWLPDLALWAEIAAHFVKPRGFFYIAENRPVMGMFDRLDGQAMHIESGYFLSYAQRLEDDADYADASANVKEASYGWNHTLGEDVSALAATGLRIEFLHEHPLGAWQRLPEMRKDEAGCWRLPGDPIPLTFSIKATKV